MRSLRMVGAWLGTLGIFVFMTGIQGADLGKEVKIINTAAEPVPVAVQGISAVSGGVQVTNAASAAIPVVLQPSDLTHLGRRASDSVTLFASSLDDYFGRALPGGTRETSWQVPAGKVLIVTDVVYHGAVSGTPANISLNVEIFNPNGSIESRPFVQNLTGNTVYAVPTNVGGEHHMVSGFLVPAGARLIPSTNFALTAAYVFGYLATDQ